MGRRRCRDTIGGGKKKKGNAKPRAPVAAPRPGTDPFCSFRPTGRQRISHEKKEKQRGAPSSLFEDGGNPSYISPWYAAYFETGIWEEKRMNTTKQKSLASPFQESKGGELQKE